MSNRDRAKPDPTAKPPVDLRTGEPHPARVYDYLLGGKDNFPADREAADRSLARFPHANTPPRQNRGFLRRAVDYLATEVGIRQFLDIGAGLPTSPNVHEVAQAANPASRVVYVDNDPLVLAHARALLTSSPEGRTAYFDADVRDPDKIFDQAQEVLDLGRPVGLFLLSVIHFVRDEEDPGAQAVTLRSMGQGVDSRKGLWWARTSLPGARVAAPPVPADPPAQRTRSTRPSVHAGSSVS